MCEFGKRKSPIIGLGGAEVDFNARAHDIYGETGNKGTQKENTILHTMQIFFIFCRVLLNRISSCFNFSL